MTNATKRKFHALLQGLGTSSSDDRTRNATADSSSPTSLSHIESITQKRRRLGLPDPVGLTSKKGAPSVTGTNSGNTFVANGRRYSSFNEPRARYCPADRVELLRRLRTFQEITDWTPKPERISEIEWAKRGWICQGKETVRCMLCHKEVNVKLKKDEEDLRDGMQAISEEEVQELRSAVVDKFTVLIVTEHQEECLWRKRGCEDSLLRLPLANPRKSLADLRQRYDELCLREQSLPHESSLRLPGGMILDEILSQLPGPFLSEPGQTDDGGSQVNRVAFALALLGWQGLRHPKLGAIASSASCHTCLRRLGLWMFRSKEVDEHGNVVVPAPMDYLDVVWEHRAFCPWKSAEAQARGQEAAKDPGWKVLLETLRNDAHLRSLYQGKSASAVRSSEPAQVSSSTSLRHPRSNTRPEAETLGKTQTSTTAEEMDDERERDVKDQERWARLKRVKNLFEIKGSKRLSRLGSRPTTANSAQSTSDVATPEEPVELPAIASQ